MMNIAQLGVLRTAINAQTDPEFVGYRDAGATGAMAEWLNGNHASQLAWDSSSNWSKIQNAIDYAKYTPATANIPTDIAGLCKLMAIMIKLTVQQNMLLGMVNGVNATNAGLVSAILDTTIQIPAGASGANVNPGGAAGVAVATVMARKASKAEALFITTTPTFGGVTAALLSWEGPVTSNDVVQAINLP